MSCLRCSHSLEVHTWGELGVNPSLMTLVASVDTVICRTEMLPCCEGTGNCQSSCFYNVIEIDFFFSVESFPEVIQFLHLKCVNGTSLCVTTCPGLG